MSLPSHTFQESDRYYSKSAAVFRADCEPSRAASTTEASYSQDQAARSRQPRFGGTFSRAWQRVRAAE